MASSVVSVSPSCSRCSRLLEPGDADAAQWNQVLAKGRLTGWLCPDCQTPIENAEAEVKAALLDYEGATQTADGRMIVAARGAWHTVSAASHPIVEDDPSAHLALTVRKGRLLIALAAHSDADLARAFTGVCAQVVEQALTEHRAKPAHRTLVVAPTEAMDTQSILIAEDHAANGGVDQGQLLLLFNPSVNPHLLNAFTPSIADAMRAHLDQPPAPPAASSTIATPIPLPRAADRSLAARTSASTAGLVVGSPAWERFWYGDRSTEWPALLEHFRDRIVHESGAAVALHRDHGLAWADLPPEQRTLMYVPAVGNEDGQGLDLGALTLSTIESDWNWDRAYARVAPHRMRPDATDLHPTDVSALRHALVPAAAFRQGRNLNPASRFGHGLAALTTTAAYLAMWSTHFIPGPLAMDVATTAGLDQDSRSALRADGPWTMVLHEPVPLSAVTADDDELDAIVAAGGAIGSDHAVFGGVIAAHPDHTIDTTFALVLVTSMDPKLGRVRFLQPALFGDHGAGRLLYSYAAQLSFASWREPPARPEATGKPNSGKALKRMARDEAARAGALHRIRILDYTPFPDGPIDAEAASAPEPGRQLTEGHMRRAYWKTGTRIGIRDADNRLVGPVYRHGVEGVTFTRERRFIRRKRVRLDLPLRGDRPVYRLNDDDSGGR